MNIIIYAKNLDLAPGLIKQIEAKFNKLTKFSDRIISFRADLSRDERHRTGQVYRVEVNLTIPDKMFRVVQNEFDLETGVNKVRDKLARQIVDYKEKLLSKRGK